MNSSGAEFLSGFIKKRSGELGLDICGIARYKVLDGNKEVLREWCEAGMNDRMQYLARNTEKRADPARHLSSVKSVVVTGMSYNSEMLQKHPGVPVISRYAYGKRYQDVITAKLDTLLAEIKEMEGSAEGKIVVDSAPFFEKPWAVEAGLGWQGKHSIIINKEIGSFFFIGILMLNLELVHDKPVETDHCGSCRICIDRCPTGAINHNRTIDTRKCISNLTIENRDPLEPEIGPKLQNRVYGCDICQEVCPWNRKAPFINHPEYSLDNEIAGMDRQEWLYLTEERFNRLFTTSPVGRVNYSRFINNIRVVLNQVQGT
jgi:epoxyqueuosine reductase